MVSTPAQRASIDPDEKSVVPIVRDKAQRDIEILRLWEAKWSARKIAEYLDIRSWAVSNIIYKHGRARKRRGPRRISIGFGFAPIGKWQQAILPVLEQAADAFGLENALKRAFVFACLLRLKRYDEITEFIGWVCRVTSYERDEIVAFVERGMRGHLIVDGQPNDEAFGKTGNEEDGGDFALRRPLWLESPGTSAPRGPPPLPLLAFFGNEISPPRCPRWPTALPERSTTR
jgi:hypothetical protein